MGLDRELGFMKELTRLRLRISTLEAALKAERAEVDAWRSGQGENYRPICCCEGCTRLRNTRAATDAARKECPL